MRRLELLLFVFLFAFCPVKAGNAEKLTVKVHNDTDEMRWQLVELKAEEVFQRLGVEAGKTIRVINARKQEVPWQLTYDGKILVEVTVMPMGTSFFTVVKGTPRDFPKSVQGRVVPERKDDISWENDRSAYRCYGPALQKSGEKAYGNDIWSKNTPEMVADKRYFDDEDTWRRIHAAGIKDKAVIDSMFLFTSFHLDHGNGLDCYAVGPSLGCGTPAIILGDSIVFPYCYKDYEILDNGPLRFTMSLTYHPQTIDGQKDVVEHRIVSLDKGSNYNKCIVWYEGMRRPYDVCSGVVIHTADTKHIATSPDYVIYADPTDEAKNFFQLYVGAVFPDATETKVVWDKSPKGGIAGHALGIKRGLKPGEKFTYYFGSAWSKYDVLSFGEWKLRTERMMMQERNALKVTIESNLSSQ